MNTDELHSDIAWDETTETYAVALGGKVLGRYPTHLQALRALENGTGHTLGPPQAPGMRSRTENGRTAPAEAVPEVERPASTARRTSMPWTDVAAFKAGKVDPPETLRQAQRWDSAVTRYTRAGLCARCASQAAWGGQIGYTRVHAPCEYCAAIVADFPGAEHVNGWRTLPEMRRDRGPLGDSVSGRALPAPGGAPTPAPDAEHAVAA